MKKIVIIISMLFLITGCTNINKLNYSDIVNNISTSSPKNNIYRTGYSYYLPRGMQVSDSTMYNEVIEDANSKYYLYVDVVSYEKKIEKDYHINDKAIYSSKISFEDKFGYVEINLLKNNKYLVEIIRKKGYDITVVNTICNATHVRQVEAQKISSKVDGMIVIGGKNSSNTQKLYDICRNECENTFYVQTVKDLNLHELKSLKSIGITAGASTPKNIIEEVRTECQK